MLSLILGPALGLLGSAIGSVFKIWERKQELQAQREKQQHEAELTKLNIAARGQEMENEQWIAQVQATADMLKSSYEHDASYGPITTGAAAWLRWVRPGLTILLITLTASFYFTDGSLHQQITKSILMMTEAAVTWWFADRAREGKK